MPFGVKNAKFNIKTIENPKNSKNYYTKNVGLIKFVPSKKGFSIVCFRDRPP